MRWDDVSLWAASSSEIPTGFGSERVGVHHLLEGRISSQAAAWSTPTQPCLSHPLLRSDQQQHILVGPPRAVISSAQDLARPS